MTQITLTKSGSNLVATDASGHSVALPLTLDSLRLLATILDGKAVNPNAPLGSPFRPTQQMVDDFLSNRKKQTELKHQIDQINSMNQLKEIF